MLEQLHWLENLTSDPASFDVTPLTTDDIAALNARTLPSYIKTSIESAAGVTLSETTAVYIASATEWVIYDPTPTAKAFICIRRSTVGAYRLSCQQVMNFYIVEDFRSGDGYCLYAKDWWDTTYLSPRVIRLSGGEESDQIDPAEQMNICSTLEYDPQTARDYYFTVSSGVYSVADPGPHMVLIPIPYDAVIREGRILRNIALGPMGVVEDDTGAQGMPNYHQFYDYDLAQDVVTSDDFPVVISRPAAGDSMLAYALIYNHSQTHPFPPNYNPPQLIAVDALPFLTTLDTLPGGLENAPGGLKSVHFSQTTGMDSASAQYTIDLDPAEDAPPSNIANSVTTGINIGLQYLVVFGVPAATYEDPPEEPEPGSLSVTQAGALARIAAKMITVTQVGALLRLTQTTLPEPLPALDETVYAEGEESTWHRHWQLTAEGQSLADVVRYGAGNKPVICGEQAHSGGYSYRNATSETPYANAAFGFDIDPAPAVRCNLLLCHNGVTRAPSGEALVDLFKLDCNGTPIAIQWDSAVNTLILHAGYIAGTDQPRYPIAPFDAGILNLSNVWHSIGLTAHLAGAEGFVSVYLNQMRLLTWTGDTRIYGSTSSPTAGSTSSPTPATPITTITGLYATGSPENANTYAGWAPWCYVDDFYLDFGDGSEKDLAPPYLRFFPRFRDANLPDIKAEMAVSGAETNGAAIGEAPPDDDGSYVGASGPAEDIYPLTPAQLAEGWAPVAQIAVAYARRVNGALDSRVTLGLAQTGGAAVSEEAQPLDMNYGYVGHRFLRTPNNRSWTIDAIDATNLSVAASGELE